MNIFDIIVIGGGHAGIEASISASKLGCKVALFTMDKNAIGRMSCNPAIGGTAKGHLVREIDALGGVMGQIADLTGIQFRILNSSKGPAVWSPRSQNDREYYSKKAIEFVELQKEITIINDTITEILTENKKVSGIKTSKGDEITAKAIVVCSGTFLNGKMHTGLKSFSGGRIGEKPVIGLTECLIKLGFEAGRLKTGTPPRLKKNSINWNILETQSGDINPQPFSFRTDKKKFPFLPQLKCFITYTNPEVHKILEKGFSQSPMFTGLIKGVGPRYCPSIEDKIVRFSDKKHHHLFLEPEGLNSDLIYVNGFSTSLPEEIQLEALKNVKGLEETEIVRSGYAVEYDFFPPHQIDLTLETKLIKGLYFAGQINGTSGYEEAAAQGLIAGINSALKIKNEPEFILKRSEAYIGVLIDDLVTKSTDEPYRMFTSRAEHRLLLRQDNADLRLSEKGYQIGLLSKDNFEKVEVKKNLIKIGFELCEKNKFTPESVNPLIELKGKDKIQFSETISKLCKRPEFKLKELLDLIADNQNSNLEKLISNEEVINQIEIELKYEGYIKRQKDLIDKLEKYEELKIPLSLNYLNLKGLSSEGKEKLNKHKPRTIGQASRLSGITHSDISILLVYLKK